MIGLTCGLDPCDLPRGTGQGSSSINKTTILSSQLMLLSRHPLASLNGKTQPPPAPLNTFRALYGVRLCRDHWVRMWLARVKGPRPHHPTLRMAIPCPSIERSAVVTARAHLLQPTASSSDSRYAESMYPYRAVSGRDTARPFARGTWNRHPESLMMRPRTLYVGEPHTNPVNMVESPLDSLVGVSI